MWEYDLIRDKKGEDLFKKNYSYLFEIIEDVTKDEYWQKKDMDFLIEKDNKFFSLDVKANYKDKEWLIIEAYTNLNLMLMGG